MPSKKAAAEAAAPRARLEIEFEQPHLLGRLFGEFDRNLVAIEDRLGVYIAARGTKVQIEGEPEAAARAREVLLGLYNRLDEGQRHRRRSGQRDHRHVGPADARRDHRAPR